MTTTARQNNLILNEDWTRIYQTFKNADFKSYDFENLRRVMLTYLKENYPEDFNDYIESSEYLALIDAIAFIGQSLAFRIDLASRENFLELAESKESVLRLARMLSYNAKRNIAASGLLKFDTISTTDTITDSNGKNLSQQVIVWNDPTNANWYEQFLLILNSAMTENTEFGRSQGNATIQGISTSQYRFNTVSSDVPIYTFTKNVAGRNMAFEIFSTAFKGAKEIYEEAPIPGNQLGFIYRNDARGAGSPNTGFYLMFKQGSLELADFNIATPTSNEKVAVESENINNDDVWLYGLNSVGAQTTTWTQVENLIGNNIAYNSLAGNLRNIYSVSTKSNDRVDLVFADGVYGNLPQGAFRVYYRVSNGLSYSIATSEMRGITVAIPYINKQGAEHTLTISLGLKYTVNNAAKSEDVDTIRANAPAVYYTQNRMITGEDYNLAPLTSSQDILKVKAINRTSSGISRNFDIIDASGKYSKVNVFADDGMIYKETSEINRTFKYTNKIDIINFVRNHIEPFFSATDVYNFYFTKFDKILFTDNNTVWNRVTTDVNISTGYFKNPVDATLLKAGAYTTSSLKYIETNSLVKFVPPTGYAFKNGELVLVDTTDPDQTDRIWTKIVKITGDGTNGGTGVLTTGLGAIILSDDVPTGAIARRIIPKFVNNLPSDIEAEIVNLAYENLNFGLRYSVSDRTWRVINSANIDLVNNFSLGKSGDTTNANLDSSWIIAFVKEADQYLIRVRNLSYIFGSVEQNRFYFDSNQKTYDSRTNQVIKDKVNVLNINTDNTMITSLKQDIEFEISDSIRYDDGYQSSAEIKLAFSDKDADGVIDNPEAFEQIVGEDSDREYLFFQETKDLNGNKIYQYIDNSAGTILIYEKESLVTITDFTHGQLLYFYSENEDRVKSVDRTTNSLILQSSYKANIGRSGLKFQYIHNANVDRRIDPSVSNIVDIYILTRSYDTDFRQYLIGAVDTEPTPPNSDSLSISFGGTLNPIKSISDEIIYHPVQYKVLFGPTAAENLQAQFKVVKNPNRSVNNNDLKVRIINAINTFFDISNWDFGDKFYLSELITYVLNSTAPDVSNIVLLPTQTSQVFGSLFEIQSRADEIFVSGATVDNIDIVDSISATEIRASTSTVVSTTGQ